MSTIWRADELWDDLLLGGSVDRSRSVEESILSMQERFAYALDLMNDFLAELRSLAAN